MNKLHENILKNILVLFLVVFTTTSHAEVIFKQKFKGKAKLYFSSLERESRTLIASERGMFKGSSLGYCQLEVFGIDSFNCDFSYNNSWDIIGKKSVNKQFYYEISEEQARKLIKKFITSNQDSRSSYYLKIVENSDSFYSQDSQICLAGLASNRSTVCEDNTISIKFSHLHEYLFLKINLKYEVEEI